jgi:pilus assembly protein Flp/PilA
LVPLSSADDFHERFCSPPRAFDRLRRELEMEGEIPMQALVSRVSRFLTSEDGPTAVEYAVMLALILVACITIVTSLGSNISGTFSKVNSTLSAS